MKKSVGSLSLALLLGGALLLQTGCIQLLGDGPQEPAGRQIRLNVQAPVSAMGIEVSEYEVTGLLIAVTDMRLDLSWDLYGPAPDYDWMMECDDYYHAADEVTTTPVLVASTAYHLTVDEWDYVAGRFKLLITAP